MLHRGELMSSRSRYKAAAFAITIIAACLAVVAMRWGLRASPAFEKIVASGRFHQVAHKGVGSAAIYQLSDEKLELRLTGFRTDDGGALQVLLIAAPDALENETVEKSEHIVLGDLKNTEGNQSYALPDDLDLRKYRAVTIWSRKHRVNFTTAPLSLIEVQSS